MGSQSRIAQVWHAISSANTVVGIAGWSLWKTLGATVGGAAGAIVSFLSSVPPWAWFLLVLAGIGGGLFVTNEFASKRLGKRLAQGTSGQEGQGGVATGTATNQYAEWVKEIDRLFVSKIESVLLRHLWNAAGTPNAEPSIEFIFQVKNNTPLTFLIDGVGGTTTIDNDPCMLDPKWPDGGSRFPPFHQANLRIAQPLLTDRGRSLIEAFGANALIRFSLADLYFKGVIETVDTVLPRIRTEFTFDIDSTGVSLDHPNVTLQSPLLRL